MKSHTLDLILSQYENKAILSNIKVDTLCRDHPSVLCDISICKPKVEFETVKNSKDTDVDALQRMYVNQNLVSSQS